MSFRDVGPTLAIGVASTTQTVVATSQTISGNALLANPGTITAGAFYVFNISQDGVGGRLLEYGDKYRFGSGSAPTLSIIDSLTDQLVFYADGTYLNFIAITRDVVATIRAPSSFTASTNLTGHIKFDWVDNSSNETGFSIQAFGLGWSELDSAAAGATTKTVVVDPGSDTYRIVAYRDSGSTTYYSQPSNLAVGTSN